LLLFLAALGAGFGQPVITKEPQDQTNAIGTTATFTVLPPTRCLGWGKTAGILMAWS
jgi:hypothetical protein